MIRYTIERGRDSWAIMQGLRTIAIFLTSDQAQKRLEELTNEEKDLEMLAKEEHKIILLEAELKLLRDWRDTWLSERDRLQADNEKLRQTLAKIADEARKTVFDVLLNR